MKKTGEVLRKAREEKGLSLHEVGIFLKINTRILQAIENGDLSKLPAKTFLRGFVQSYAKYLKLNSDDVLDLFQSELKPQQEDVVTATEFVEKEIEPQQPVEKKEIPEEVAPVVAAETESNINRSSTNPSVLMGPGLTTDTLKIKTIVISALSLVLVFVVYFGNNLIRRYQKEAEAPSELSLINSPEESAEEPVSSVLTPEQPNATTSETPASITPVVTTPAAPHNSVIATPATTTTPPEVIAPAPTPTPPAPKPVVAPTPPPAPVATQQKSASETTSLPTTPPAATASATEAKPVAEGKSVEVIVEAKDNVEIEYASAKSSPQKLLLKSDQIHTFKSRSGVRLKISNGGAVNVIVNGQDLGAPGALGQSIQLTYE